METVVSLPEALAALKMRRLPRIGEALVDLEAVRASARMAIVLADLQPAVYSRIARGGFPLIDEKRIELWNAAINAVNRIFPITWSMADEPLNYEGGPVYLYIETQGTPFSDDEWDDIFRSIEDQEGESWSLNFFMKFMDCTMDDRDIWEQAAEHFGWPEMEPAWWSRPVGRLDEKRMFRRLKRAKLEPFIAAWNTIWHTTGNYFLDYNELEAYDVPQFTLENVLLLKAEWAAAQLLLDEWKTAAKMIKDNPGVMERVLKIFEKSLSVTEELHRARTLAEVFGGRYEGLVNLPDEGVTEMRGRV